MKGSTNEKLREIITTFDEGIKELRSEVRSCLGSIMGDINRIREAVNEIEERTKPITANMPKECKWIGYLCKFKDKCNEEWQCYEILKSVDYSNTEGAFENRLGTHWQECEIVKLTDPEVYKISQKDLEKSDMEIIQRFLSDNRTNDKYKVI